jgi:hypothetical protein
MSFIMDKLQLTEQNLGRVFNFRSGHLHAADLWCYWVKLPNLNLQTWPKELLGTLLLDIALLGFKVQAPGGCMSQWHVFNIIFCYEKTQKKAMA